MPQTDTIVLTTPRLVLREVVVDDAYAFRDYMTDEAYWRNLPIDPPSLSSVRAFLERCVRDRGEEPRKAWFLAAVEIASGRIVGEGILHVRSQRWGQGEVGWGVDVARTGEGLATEIGAAMLRLGFESVGLHRVVARARVGHAASRRVMHKLGMREEGVLREDVCGRGEWWSSLLCAVLSHEWEARGQALLSDATGSG